MHPFLVICAICLQLNSLSIHSPESLQQRDTACNQCLTDLKMPTYTTEKPTECMMQMETPSPRNILKSEETLDRGEFLMSENGFYRAYMQIDGNFVVYDTHSDPADIYRPKWASNTFGIGRKVMMTKNGNLAVFDGNDHMIWATNTRGSGHYLKLENDGRLMMYNESGIIWAS